jgi:hypothetical protein
LPATPKGADPRWKTRTPTPDRGGPRSAVSAVDGLSDSLLTPVNANGSPAAAVYKPQKPGGPPAPFAINVLDVVAGRISAIHSFIDPALFEPFGLPDRQVS